LKGSRDSQDKEITMEAQNAGNSCAQIDSTVELALLGDRELLGRLFSRYINQLYRIAFRVLGTREDAEDAVQDGLLAATQNLKSFEGRAQFSTWLTRVVVNAALMRRRKLHGRISASLDQEGPDDRGPSWAAKIADPRPDPESAYAREEELTMVRQWLDKLPALYRSALWLRDVEGMTTQEAAQALRVSEGTLKSRLHRARVEFFRRVHEAPPAGVRISRTACKTLAMRKAMDREEHVG
jgi:RNA polymerase sigma-70 factor, ECF subfamily